MILHEIFSNDKEPYFIAYAVFDDKALVDYGFMVFNEKDENKAY